MNTEENLILDNMKLAYNLAWKYKSKLSNLVELEDLQSLCLLGLTKAAKTFDSSLGYKFSTYSYKFMKNEVLIYLNSELKHSNNISLSTQINDDLELQDVMPLQYDIYEEVEKRISNDNLYKGIEKLNDYYKIIITYKLKGMTLMQISDKLGIPINKLCNDYGKAINILRNDFMV